MYCCTPLYRSYIENDCLLINYGPLVAGLIWELLLLSATYSLLLYSYSIYAAEANVLQHSA